MKIVRDVLDKKGWTVWTIGPSARVREALARMAEKDVGALVVTDEGGILGIISERDFARKVIEEGHSIESLVSDVMAREPTCVTPGETIPECMSLMTDRRVRHLPVLDADRKLAGLISIGDVVAATLSECESRIDELKNLVFGA